MATYIKTLKEDNGDITYPQTVAGAVYTSQGSDVQTFITNSVTAENLAATSLLTPTATSSMISIDRTVVSAVLTSQTNTSWSNTVSINKLTFGNMVIYCANNLDTGFGASTADPKNIMLTYPTSLSSIWGFTCNAAFDGNASAYLTYSASNGTRMDLWVNRSAGSTVQNIKLSFITIGVLSS